MATFDVVFKSGVTTQVTLDEGNLSSCASHRKVADLPNKKRVVRTALQNPIGSPFLRSRLEGSVKGGSDDRIQA